MTSDERRIAGELAELSLAGLQLLADLVGQSPDLKKEVAEQAKKAGDHRSGPVGERRGTKRSSNTKEPKGTFGGRYQRWYSQALRVVQQLLPDRYEEFRQLYRLDKRPNVLDVGWYRISDYVQGTRVIRNGVEVFDAASVALSLLMLQHEILDSAAVRLDSALADIRGTVEAGLLDDELDNAEKLLRAKHLRSAGVIAGVVLERHLKRVVTTHEITFRKKAQIANLNNALKEAEVYDIPQWRFIERLGDIRNICAHDKERDPTAEEVEDLIRGTEKVVATVF